MSRFSNKKRPHTNRKSRCMIMIQKSVLNKRPCSLIRFECASPCSFCLGVSEVLGLASSCAVLQIPRMLQNLGDMKLAAAFYTVLRAYGTNETEIPTVAYLNGREPWKEAFPRKLFKNILRISSLTILSPFLKGW